MTQWKCPGCSHENEADLNQGEFECGVCGHCLSRKNIASDVQKRSDQTAHSSFCDCDACMRKHYWEKNQSLENENKRLTANNEKQAKFILTQQERLNARNETVVKLDKLTDDSARENERLELKIVKLHKTHDLLLADYRESASTVHDLRAERAELRGTIEGLNLELKNKQIHINYLVDTKWDAIRTRDGDIDNHNTEIERLEAEGVTHNNDLNDVIDVQADTIKQLQRDIKYVTEDNDKMIAKILKVRHMIDGDEPC